MKKQALLALMLALALILSGCTLIQKDPKVDAATEIVRLGDEVVTKGEIQEQVNSQLQYMAYVYSMYGHSYDATSAENIASAQDSVLETVKEDLVSKAKIRELGLDQLTEEEEAKVQSDAESTYQSNLDYIIDGEEDYADLSDEEKTEKATAKLEETGYTMETALKNARESLLEDKLRQEIIKDVAVTEEEIQAEFDSKVETAKGNYENDAASWTTAANNGTKLYYTPAGVRFVKQILVKFTDEDQALIDAANEKVTDAKAKVTEAESKVSDAQAIIDDENATEEDKTAAQTSLEAAQADLTAAQAEVEAANAEVASVTETAFGNIDEAADGILQELEQGADWDTLMAERTQDPGMQSGVTAERGYAVTSTMTSFDSAFVEAAMALEKIGDVSGKVKGTTYGYYIIRYVGDAVEGPIALEEVKDEIESSLLSSKQDSTYEDTIHGWVDAADFKVDRNALNN